MTKQATTDRRRIGDRILAERSLGEATIPQRERAARTRARQHAQDILSGWLQRGAAKRGAP